MRLLKLVAALRKPTKSVFDARRGIGLASVTSCVKQNLECQYKYLLITLQTERSLRAKDILSLVPTNGPDTQNILVNRWMDRWVNGWIVDDR